MAETFSAEPDPAATPIPASPLVAPPSGRATATGPGVTGVDVTGPGVAVTERPVAALVQIAVWPGKADALDRVLLGGGWPIAPAPGRSEMADDGTSVALDAGPGRFLIEGAADLHERLLAAVSPELGTVTDLTHARVCLRLAGRRAAWILLKGTSIDLRDRAFPPGAVALTTIHAMGVVIRRVDADTFDVMPLRGFARAFAHWLVEASRPDGR